MIERERAALPSFIMKHQHASNKTNRSNGMLRRTKRSIRYNQRCLIRLFLPALLPFFILAGCGAVDPSGVAAPAPLPVTMAAATAAAPPASAPTLTTPTSAPAPAPTLAAATPAPAQTSTQSATATTIATAETPRAIIQQPQIVFVSRREGHPLRGQPAIGPDVRADQPGAIDQ